MGKGLTHLGRLLTQSTTSCQIFCLSTILIIIIIIVSFTVIPIVIVVTFIPSSPESLSFRYRHHRNDPSYLIYHSHCGYPYQFLRHFPPKTTIIATFFIASFSAVVVIISILVIVVIFLHYYFVCQVCICHLRLSLVLSLSSPQHPISFSLAAGHPTPYPGRDLPRLGAQRHLWCPVAAVHYETRHRLGGRDQGECHYRQGFGRCANVPQGTRPYGRHAIPRRE